MRSLQSCVSRFLKQQQAEDEEEEGDGMEQEEGRERAVPEVMASAQTVLKSLVNRMVKSEPEDFELDKSSDFSPGSSVGMKNRELARLMMGVQEVSEAGVSIAGSCTLTHAHTQVVQFTQTDMSNPAT